MHNLNKYELKELGLIELVLRKGRLKDAQARAEAWIGQGWLREEVREARNRAFERLFYEIHGSTKG